MVGLPTCPACGEPRHNHLCMPALATLYADEKHDHAEDRRKMVRLEVENADLRQQLLEQRMSH